MALTGKFDMQRLFNGAMLLGVLALAWAVEGPGRRAAHAAPGSAHAHPDAPDAPGPGRGQSSWSSAWARRQWAWWKQVALRTFKDMGEDRLVAVAAGVVFYALLAIFPAITAFVSLYGLLADPTTIDRHLSMLSDVLPDGGLSIVSEQVSRIAGRPGELSFGFVGGLAIALWSANAGIKAMIDALNVVEDRHEERGFVRLNILSLSFTFGALVFLMLAVGAVVAFPVAMSAFGLANVLDVSTGLLRWPLLLAVAVLSIAILYRFGPSGKRRRGHFITTGVVFAALAWLVGSSVLSFYMSNFADYNATYGSLGAGIGLMMWMWVSAIAVLVGAEIDMAIDRMQSSEEPLK